MQMLFWPHPRSGIVVLWGAQVGAWIGQGNETHWTKHCLNCVTPLKLFSIDSETSQVRWTFSAGSVYNRTQWWQCLYAILATGVPLYEVVRQSIELPFHFAGFSLCSWHYFTEQNASAIGGLRPQNSHRCFDPGPHWGTSVPLTSVPLTL